MAPRPSTPTPKVNLGLRISPEIHAGLTQLAVERGESLNTTAEALLAAGLKRRPRKPEKE